MALTGSQYQSMRLKFRGLISNPYWYVSEAELDSFVGQLMLDATSAVSGAQKSQTDIFLAGALSAPAFTASAANIPDFFTALRATAPLIVQALTQPRYQQLKNQLTGALSFAGVRNEAQMLGYVAVTALARQIGQRTSISTTPRTDVTPYNCRIFETATQDINSIGVDFGNWLVVSGVETALADNLTIYGASVEFPAGTFTQLTFNGGNASVVVAPGGDAIGDVVPCQFIPKGSKYFIRWMWWNPTATPCIAAFNGAGVYVPGGDAIERTATNKVLSGTVNDDGLSGAAMMWPSAIKSSTIKKIPAIIGNSREAGTNVVQDATGIVGSVSLGISTYTAFLKLAVAGETAAGYIGNSARRAAMQLAYTDFTISTYGINDIYGGAALPAAVIASQRTLAARRPGKPYYVTTLAPGAVGTTDAYATLANQTVGAQNTNCEAYNSLVLAGLGGDITGTLDLRAAFEDSLTSGKWKVNGAANAYTSDGTHPSRLANQGVVIPAASIGL